MPEASVYEYDGFFRDECDVWSASDSGEVFLEAVTISSAVKRTSKQKFGFGVLSSDAGHDMAAYLF